MKFKIGDQVLVSSGKDKGKRSEIIRVYPKSQKVLVKGINLYFKHVKPVGDRAGERKQLERALPLAKIAILNNKGEADRIAYKMINGNKVRVFAKTQAEIATVKVEKKAKKIKEKAKEKVKEKASTKKVTAKKVSKKVEKKK